MTEGVLINMTNILCNEQDEISMKLNGDSC